MVTPEETLDHGFAALFTNFEQVSEIAISTVDFEHVSFKSEVTAIGRSKKLLISKILQKSLVNNCVGTFFPI